MGNAPQYIVISGIDGVGKTSVVKGVQQALIAEGEKTIYMWLRYNHVLVKPIHAICRLVGLSRRRDSSQGKVWRHEFYRNQWFCSFYIFLTWIDTWLGRWRMSRQFKNKGTPDFIICDRWVNDILVDLAVDSRRADFFNSTWFSRFQNIHPINTRLILLTRDSREILECRPENVDDPDFSFRLKMYDCLQDAQMKLLVVSNNGTVTQAIQSILNQIER